MPQTILSDLAFFGPDHCELLSTKQAMRYTRRLARTHYENFSAVSWLLPRRWRDDFAHVYAFCRWADDLGDETSDPGRSLELLAWWRLELDRCYAGEPRHPVFVALAPTIRRYAIPRKPFDDLIDAFIQDQTVLRYDTWDQVLDYCARSANPVGRLVLYVCGYRDPRRQALSDATCTALQLANFWQDVRRDIIERDRVYVPRRVADMHGLDMALLTKAVKLEAESKPACGSGCPAGPRPSSGIVAQLPAYRATIRHLADRTWPLFQQGSRLWEVVDPVVRPHLKLFTYGGQTVLRMIERQGYDTLTRRPRLSRWSMSVLMMRAMGGKLWELLRPIRPDGVRGRQPVTDETA